MERKTGEKIHDELGGFLLTGFYLGVEIKEDERDSMCLIWRRREICTEF
jgi:hypothetical protein